MITDCHIHFPMGEIRPEDIGVAVHDAEKLGIKKLWNLGDVLKYGYYPAEEQVKEINDQTITTVDNFPETIIGFCFLNPANSPDFNRSEIVRCFEGKNFKGIKLEVSVNCRDQRLQPIMELLREYNGILVHHSWYKSTRKCENESVPADIAFLASKYPDIKIVMAHLSGCGIRGILDIKEHKNVYIDTSGGQPVAGLVEYAVKELGAERVLYGSDVPCRDFACQLGRIHGAEITKDDKNKIFTLNAESLL